METILDEYGIVLITFGLLPLLTLLRALLRWDSTQAVLAAAALLGQIATRRPFDRVADLPWRWTFSVPLGWAALGVLILDATWRAVSSVGAAWKGRVAPVHTS